MRARGKEGEREGETGGTGGEREKQMNDFLLLQLMSRPPSGYSSSRD